MSDEGKSVTDNFNSDVVQVQGEDTGEYLRKRLGNGNVCFVIIKLLQILTSLALLGCSGKLLNTFASTDGNIDIATTTGDNVAALVASVITPVLSAGVFSWDSLPFVKNLAKDANIYTNVLSASEITQFLVWCASAAYFTTQYSGWSCSDYESLQEEFDVNFSWSNYSNGDTHFFPESISLLSDDNLAEIAGLKHLDEIADLRNGLNGLNSSLHFDLIALANSSYHFPDPPTGYAVTFAGLEKSCMMKKASMFLSWAGVALFLFGFMFFGYSLWRYKRNASMALRRFSRVPFTFTNVYIMDGFPVWGENFSEVSRQLASTQIATLIHPASGQYYAEFDIKFPKYEKVFFLRCICCRNMYGIGDRPEVSLYIEPASAASQEFESTSHSAAISLAYESFGGTVPQSAHLAPELHEIKALTATLNLEDEKVFSVKIDLISDTPPNLQHETDAGWIRALLWWWKGVGYKSTNIFPGRRREAKTRQFESSRGKRTVKYKVNRVLIVPEYVDDSSDTDDDFENETSAASDLELRTFSESELGVVTMIEQESIASGDKATMDKTHIESV